MVQYCSPSDYQAMKKPARNSRKGDNGKLLIIAGNEKYHGSAVLAILAAVRFCDLVYFHSTAENQEIAKSYLKKIKSSTPCVICGKPRDPRCDPFCSKRCADVDLHHWLSGAYVVPGAPIAADEPEGEED